MNGFVGFNNPDSEKVYSITLSDGTKISGLRLNGNNFVSSVPITKEIFEGKLFDVVISDNEGYEEKHDRMTLAQIAQYGGDDYYFILLDVTPEQIRQEKLRADIDYIAMMAEVDL